MIKLFFIPVLVILSCGSAKKNQSAAGKDSIGETITTEQALKDSIPACLRKKIDSFRVMPKHEQPQKVTEYTYKGKKVYHVTMPCCDFFSEVYDGNCVFLGSPDGGITGKGDGKLPGFFTEAKNEKLIWKAKN